MNAVYLLCLVVGVAIHAQSQGFWEKTTFRGSSGWFRPLAVSPIGHVIAHGTNGTYRSTDRGSSWIQVFPDSIGNTVRALAVNFSGTIFAGTAKGGGSEGRLVRSTDQGMTWVETGLPNLMYNAIAFNRDGQVFAGTSFGYGGVFRSTDDGVSWTTLWPTSREVYSIAIASSGSIVAGVGYAGLFRSTDGGGSWDQITNGLPWTNPSVFDLLVHSNGHMFSAVDSVNGLDDTPVTGGVFRSTDHGASWVSISNGLTDTRVISFSIGSNGHLFAGTWGGGAFRSTDNGGSWAEHGLTGLAVYALVTGPEGFIYAATNGGIFRSVMPTLGVEAAAGTPTSFGLAQNYPNPFNPSTSITYELPEASVVRLNVYDMLGREVSVLVNERRDAGVHQVKFDGSGLSSGVYLYRLQAGTFVQTRKLVLLQ